MRYSRLPSRHRAPALCPCVRNPGQGNHRNATLEHCPTPAGRGTGRRRPVRRRHPQGAGRRTRHHQAAWHADRRREGRLPALRHAAPTGRSSASSRARRRRRQEARRQAGAGAGRRVEPHAVPAAGQDRPDDRDDERHAGARARSSTSSSPTTTRPAPTSWCRRSPSTSRAGTSSRASRSAASRAPSTTRNWRRSTAPTCVAFTGTAEALTALQEGNCVALRLRRYVDPAELMKPEWKDYDMPLETDRTRPWGLAVAQGGRQFAAFMSRHGEGLAQERHDPAAREEVRHQADASSPRRCTTKYRQ